MVHALIFHRSSHTHTHTCTHTHTQTQTQTHTHTHTHTHTLCAQRSTAPTGYSLDTTTLPMIMFMMPLITELLVHLAAFLRVGSRLPPTIVPLDGDKPANGLLAASAAVLSYGPATATYVCALFRSFVRSFVCFC
jgi:hypothetical protein